MSNTSKVRATQPTNELKKPLAAPAPAPPPVIKHLLKDNKRDISVRRDEQVYIVQVTGPHSSPDSSGTIGSSGETMSLGPASVRGLANPPSYADSVSEAVQNPHALPGQAGLVSPVVPPMSMTALLEAAQCSRSTTKEHFANILRALRTPLPEQQRELARREFDALLAGYLSNLQKIWKGRSTMNSYKYGSDWIQGGVTPLEANVRFGFNFARVCARI